MEQREIKFRCWDKTRKEWQYFTLLELQQGQAAQFWSQLENWCQYTGLLDKNGKEIFEGDIVTIEGIKHQVKYLPGGYIASNLESGNITNFREMPNMEFETVEVISNIYEKPELLT